jgi:hypothetical protein
VAQQETLIQLFNCYIQNNDTAQLPEMLMKRLQFRKHKVLFERLIEKEFEKESDDPDQVILKFESTLDKSFSKIIMKLKSTDSLLDN